MTLRVLFPTLMAVIVFFVFTDILYSGGRRESLAAQVEKRLIEASLRLAAYDAEKPGEVLVVSLTDADLAKLSAAPSTLVRDANLRDYAKVVQALAALKPRLLVVSWLPTAQPSDAAYWQALTDVLTAVNDPEHVIIGYPIAEIAEVPAAIRRYARVLEGEDCIYDINSFCTYNPKWKTWLIQALADELWPRPAPYHVSTNLPHVLPNFLLNLPRRETLARTDFSAVLGGNVSPEQVAGKIVVVGNDTSQNPLLKGNKSILRRTYTAASSDDGKNLLATGTPLHVFWAQLSQMFVDGATIAIAPPAVALVMLVVFGAIILVVMSRAGQAASVALLLFATISAPGLNALAVRYLHVYLPLFETGYGCFLVYVFCAFGLMSYHNFKRFQLEVRQRNYGLTADLKGNFVSLISHNLNTPVAKLLGLIDTLLLAKRLPEWDESLKECRRLVTQMQFLTKSALLSTTLDQSGRPTGRANLAAVFRECEQTSIPLLRRLGIDWTLLPPGDEVLFAPTALDPRLGAHAIAAMAILAGQGGAARVQCEVTLSGATLHVRIGSTQRLPAKAQDDVLADTLVQYAQAIAAHYGGAFELEPLADGLSCVKLTLPTLG